MSISRCRQAFSICLLCLSACSSSAPTTNKTAVPEAGSASVVSASEQATVFEDITGSLSLSHVYHNGEESDQFTYLEAMGGGLGVIDFDKDGWPDLFLPDGGRITSDQQIQPLPGMLVRNLDGRALQNASVGSRTDRADKYAQGIAVGDLNSDGFPDMLVTGYGGLNLYLNLGDGTFVESASALGLDDPSWSTSAGFGDLDGDGLLDLYVANYVDWSWANHPKCNSSAGRRDVCPPAAFAGLQDMIFMNNGDTTFRRVTSEVGLVDKGKGLGVVCADLDDDRQLDIYVANDTTSNFLYANQGHGQFKEVGIASGTALDERGVANGSMGIAVLDYDGDLSPDLWVCNFEDETFGLYKNDGNMRFRHVTSSTGIAALGTLFVAFGTAAADFDNDGDEDLVVTSGHVLRYPPGNTLAQAPLLLKNNGRGRFTRQAFDSANYFSQQWRGRGLVAVDFNLDGKLDLAISHVNQPAALLANRTTATGNWCGLELIGRKSNRDAIGAKIVFRTNAKSYLRLITGGGSYLSQNPYTVHCAFRPGEELQQLEITWPGGATQTITDSVMNQYQQIIEPSQP